jgi:hypothetical protein
MAATTDVPISLGTLQRLPECVPSLRRVAGQPLELPGELLRVDTRSFEAIDLAAIMSRVSRHLVSGRVVQH